MYMDVLQCSFLLIVIVSLCDAAEPTTKMCSWSPSKLHGRQPLNRTAYEYPLLENINNFMKLASYKPIHCLAKQKVAVILPYRDREQQLKIFLLNVLPKLYRQNLEFTVYIIEQAGTDLFNKGALMNIGFLEASKLAHYDCIIFHDVDILPEDDRNYYICGKNPRHLAVMVEQFNYSLFHSEFIGGITAFTRVQFKDINGFSNLYKGWGSEDDDAYRRIRSAGYNIDRPDYNISFCGSIQHEKATRGNDRCTIFFNYGRYWQYDGLNNIKYSVVKTNTYKMFHRYLVKFDTDLLRQDMEYLVKNTEHSSLLSRYPSFEDGFCKWFLNQQLFEKSFIDNTCEMT